MRCTMKKILIFSIITALVLLMSACNNQAVYMDEKTENNWEVYNYNDKPEEKYLDYVGTGLFTDNTNKEHSLVFKFKVHPELRLIEIGLLEYGLEIVENSGNAKFYDVTIIDDNNSQEILTGIMNPDSDDGVLLISENADIAIDYLRRSNVVRFSIADRDNLNKKYVFMINSKKFNELV